MLGFENTNTKTKSTKMFPQKHKKLFYARIRYLIVVCVFLFTSVFAFISLQTSQIQQVTAATSSNLNFQGRLYNADGSVVNDGYYNIEFNLYSVDTGGTSLWTEEYYDSNGVSAGNDNRLRVVNGYFSANLGSLTSFPGSIEWDQEHWLTINVGGTAQTSTPTYDGEMTPRIKLTAVPYAFISGAVTDSSGNEYTGDDLIQNQNSADQTGDFRISGTGRANTSLTTPLLDSISGGLNLGTSTATGVTIGGTTNTTAVTLQGAATATYTIGTSDNTGGITLGNSTATNTISIGSAAGASNTQTINIGTSGTASSTTNVAIGSTIAGVTTLQSQGGVDINSFASISGSLALEAGTDYSTTGTSNNVDFGAVSLIRLTGASAQTITGIANGTDGEILTIVNAASQAATISNQSGSSTAANRIITGTGSNLTLLSDASITLAYDSSDSRWRVTGAAPVVGGSTATLQTAYDADTDGSDATIALTADDDSIIIQNPSSSGTDSSYLLTIDNLSTGTTGGLDIQSAGTGNLLKITDTTATARDVLTIADGGATTFRNQTNSTAAFAVQNAAGTSIFNIDTTTADVDLDGSIYVYNTVCLESSCSSYLQETGTGLELGTTTASRDIDLQASGLNFQDKDNSYATTFSIASGGATTFQNATDSTTAFQVQNAAGTSIFNVNTSSGDGRVQVGNTSLSGLLTVSGDATVALKVQQTGTFDVVQFQDGSNNVFKIIDGGAATFQNVTNSATAFQVQNAAGTGVFTIDTTNSRIGIATGADAPTADLTFGEGANREINVLGRASNAAGNGLTLSAGDAGSGASAFSGGTLTLQGGDAAGTGNANGGGVTITGGAGIGTGVQGLINLSTTAFDSASTQAFASSGSLSSGLVDQYSTIPVNATATDVTVTIPAPASGNQIVGRVLYISAVNGSEDFTISLAGTSIDIALKENSTATLIWNGTGWTAAGASSSTDLQSAYNNTLTSAGGAELILNAPGGNADGLTIRNNGTTPIMGAILEAQTSIGSNLFSVNDNATEYADNGGAENTTFTMWTGTPDGGTVTRYTTVGDYIATGQGSVSVVTTADADEGAENTLASALTANLQYNVSLAIRSTANFTALDVVYSPDGTNTGTVDCSTGNTVTEGKWTRINCSFTAPSSGITTSNAIFVRQSDATARTFYIDNLSVNVGAAANHAADGSVDLALGTNWTAFGTLDALTRDTSTIFDTSGSVSVDTPNSADRGVRNNLSIAPDTETQYLVTFYARSSNTFNDIRVRYTRDGGTNFVSCVDYNTQSVSTSAFTRITCLFTTDSTTPTNADLVIDQPTASDRNFHIDALSITLNTNTASNVQVGGGNLGGPTTLFTLDRSAGAPIANNNDAYLGSMYYDTVTGRIQCYEADGWGACGAAPDNYVNLNPEYAGAVLNGSGVGTMTADLCADESGVLSVNTSLCASGESRNYYRWTSPQATQQTYSIYVSYQLPDTFNGFASDDTVQLVARADSTSNAAVTYEMYKSTGSSLVQCGSGETTVVTSADTWQSVGINGNEATGCALTSSSAGDFIIFKINMKANSNANAYVSTLSFTTTGR